MTDLNQLLKDFYDNRLSYKQVYREKFEALLTAIVADIEALKAVDQAMTGMSAKAIATDLDRIKRGPGRPPKEAK